MANNLKNTITDVDLYYMIRSNKGKKKFYHLSKTPITEIKNVDQDLVKGFNSRGRPLGFYFSIAGSWLKNVLNISGIDIFQYKYIYKIEINKTRLLILDSIAKIEKFDKKYPDFWIYQPLNVESLNKVFNKIKKTKKKTSYTDFLIKNKYIINNKQDFIKLMYPSIARDNIDLVMNESKRKRWDIIAKDYDGIILDPYFSSYSKYQWYSSFDVAQGCIWNKKGIVNYNLVGSNKFNPVHGGFYEWSLTDFGKKLLI